MSKKTFSLYLGSIFSAEELLIMLFWTCWNCNHKRKGVFADLYSLRVLGMLWRKHCQRRQSHKFTSSSSSKAELIPPGRVVGWDLTRGIEVCNHDTVTAALHLSRSKTVGKVY